MHTSAQKRLVRFSGVLLLSLLVVALGVQAAQAAQGTGSGTSTFNTLQLPTLAQVQQHQGIGPYAPRVATAQSCRPGGPGAATTPAAGRPRAWRPRTRGGRAGPDPAPAPTSTTCRTPSQGAARSRPRRPLPRRARLPRPPGSLPARSRPRSSSSSPRGHWFAVAGGPASSRLATYCAQHPEDPLCSAA